jgi:hypothetical protein
MCDPVALLRIEFPVADPEYPQALWTWASCVVEVPDNLAGRSVKELRAGARMLVAGQLSEREVVENGSTTRRSVIVAALVKWGPPPKEMGAPV